MRPQTFASLLGCMGLLMASSCGETSSSSPQSAGVAGQGVAGAGTSAAGKGNGGSDTAGRGGAGGGSAGTVFDPCKGVPPPQYRCVPAEQAWEWNRTSGDPSPLPEPGGEGGVGNGGASGEAGAPGVTFPPGTCPLITSISEQLGPGASAGFGSGQFNNGQCCYMWGIACG